MSAASPRSPTGVVDDDDDNEADHSPDLLHQPLSPAPSDGSPSHITAVQSLDVDSIDPAAAAAASQTQGLQDGTSDISRPDLRNVPIRQLLKRTHRKRGLRPMPSTLQRHKRRKERTSQPPSSSQHPSTNTPNSNPIAPTTSSADASPFAAQTPDAGPSVETHTDLPTSASPVDEELSKGVDPDEEQDPDDVVAPQVKIDEQGNIVIDKASLVVPSTTIPDDIDRPVNTVEHHVLGNPISSASFAKRDTAFKWSLAETDKFYHALTVFGSDFSLMQASSFPRRSRRQLKLKFKREERLASQRVDDALNAPRRPISSAPPPDRASVIQQPPSKPPKPNPKLKLKPKPKPNPRPKPTTPAPSSPPPPSVRQPSAEGDSAQPSSNASPNSLSLDPAPDNPPQPHVVVEDAVVQHPPTPEPHVDPPIDIEHNRGDPPADDAAEEVVGRVSDDEENILHDNLQVDQYDDDDAMPPNGFDGSESDDE